MKPLLLNVVVVFIIISVFRYLCCNKKASIGKWNENNFKRVKGGRVTLLETYRHNILKTKPLEHLQPWLNCKISSSLEMNKEYVPVLSMLYFLIYIIRAICSANSTQTSAFILNVQFYGRKLVFIRYIVFGLKTPYIYVQHFDIPNIWKFENEKSFYFLEQLLPAYRVNTTVRTTRQLLASFLKMTSSLQ